MSDGYIKGLITGILTALGITVLSVLIYFLFFNDVLGNLDSDTAPLDIEVSDSDEYQDFVNKENMIMAIIKQKYYEEADEKTMFDGAYRGIVDSLNDPYSCYFSKEEVDAIMDSSNGEYVGIGCYVGQMIDSKEMVVVSVIPGSPSEKAGLQAGDVIIAADGRDLTDMNIDLAVTYVRGRAGTKVVITVKRDKETLDLEMIRATVTPETVESIMLDDNIGFIRMVAFHGHTPEQFKRELEKLESEGMEKLILDLRGNPGGNYDTAIEMLDIFLDKDMLVGYIDDAAGNQENSYTEDSDRFDKPLVILINENSASAAELFTQCMRDYEKATVIGKTSYGKGVYQNLYPVSNDGDAVKITGGRFYSPKGICIQGVGIVPDITVEYTDEPNEKGLYPYEYEDSQAKAAIEYLKKK